MPDCVMSDNLLFYFTVDHSDGLGSIASKTEDQALARGYALGKMLKVTYADIDSNLEEHVIVTVPPHELDAFQSFMDNVGLDPDRAEATNDSDTLKAIKCGWRAVTMT